LPSPEDVFMLTGALYLSAVLTLGQPPAVPPGETLPPPTPLVLPAPPPTLLAKPITLAEFACSFQPLPGTYEITFIHPIKKCPVCVTFTLPADCGCPKMRVGKCKIVFDYGTHEVDIRFKLFGKVAVVTR
jgi:hypothetical protein